jgi:competence protein ComEA
MTQTPQYHNFTTQPLEAQVQQPPSQQQTAPEPILSIPPEPNAAAPPSMNLLKRKFTRIIAIIITLALAVALYLIWHTPASTSSPPGITQQNFNGISSNSGGSTVSSTTTGADIHVYVVGAVKHPGVYTLPSGARVYQLLQAAGGALPNANLVALNLAAQLSDGEEVYVLANGETPPTFCNWC